jgi:hypothetical protein
MHTHFVANVIHSFEHAFKLFLAATPGALYQNACTPRSFW